MRLRIYEDDTRHPDRHGVVTERPRWPYGSCGGGAECC